VHITDQLQHFSQFYGYQDLALFTAKALDKLSKGDGVMADKGFLIQDELAARQAHLVIPPLLKKKPQFSEEELDRTRSVANLRIHVERCMERIKNYHIFDRAFPISMVDSASDIFVVICALVNFLPPLVK